MGKPTGARAAGRAAGEGVVRAFNAGNERAARAAYLAGAGAAAGRGRTTRAAIEGAMRGAMRRGLGRAGAIGVARGLAQAEGETMRAVRPRRRVAAVGRARRR